ncbi:phosphoadenosine phosphosulfate reductase domain-containing protein [Paenibacillus cymbidii]|uniref:phosphoadenosine phosphosulfate reductase domain-containing protein n=1 Tax=Paenibacillus cymbidii TaxID=1639034 RepID=UPI00108132B7|nr:phosphoadenosine phosphosulfate reductase family protein [Paenibacillus cymbidii]
MDLQTKVMAAVAEIAEQYCDPDTQGRPWAVSWSGGKDSTTVLALVCRALQMLPSSKRTREVIVIMSDTKIENPILEDYMRRQVRAVNRWARQNAMPLTAEIVSRPIKRSVWVGWLGWGWTLPTNGDDRYCTHALKIEPQNQRLTDVNPCLQLIGSRTEESTRRAATIETYREERGSRFTVSPYSDGRRIYMPIVEWTTDEVWQVLLNALPWGSSDEIRKLYKDATGECALINPGGSVKATQACGARFGCWVCPPITKDRSTENMSAKYEWMKPLTEWRQLLKDAHNPKKHPDWRSGYRRNRTPLGPGKGCLAIHARKYLLTELLQAQQEVNTLRAYDENPLHRVPIELISAEEIELIRAAWEEDAVKRPWLIDDREMEPGDWDRAVTRLAEKEVVRKQKRAEKKQKLADKAYPAVTI